MKTPLTFAAAIFSAKLIHGAASHDKTLLLPMPPARVMEYPHQQSIHASSLSLAAPSALSTAVSSPICEVYKTLKPDRAVSRNSLLGVVGGLF
ncbi:hypothetical protein BJ741DRAFT_637329 [Chytriomyces cf. hyalinus JEL632]|nr:hypothetical protein BJ741DRAFT_637329 [Chytriomyces cf. hyalinus JEL632]